MNPPSQDPSSEGVNNGIEGAIGPSTSDDPPFHVQLNTVGRSLVSMLGQYKGLADQRVEELQRLQAGRLSEEQKLNEALTAKEASLLEAEAQLVVARKELADTKKRLQTMEGKWKEAELKFSRSEIMIKSKDEKIREIEEKLRTGTEARKNLAGYSSNEISEASTSTVPSDRSFCDAPLSEQNAEGNNDQ